MGDVIEGQFGKPVSEEDTTESQPQPPTEAGTPAPGAGLVHQPVATEVIRRTGINPLVVAGVITGTVVAFAAGLYTLWYFQKNDAREERKKRRLSVGEMREKAQKRAVKKRRKPKPLPARGPVVDVDADD